MTSFKSNFISTAIKKYLKALSPATAPAEFMHICTDSRQVSAGDLFVALVGESLDGHRYVDEAFNNGAAACIIHDEAVFEHLKMQHPLYLVSDTLLAYQALAQSHLKAMPALRVALTGSSGKTTTKELIRAALSECLGEGAVYASSGNHNNHIGVPLSALEVQTRHAVAIFEMGMNHFGEIALLANIVKPHVGLINNIGSAHSGNVGGPDGVARAKAELYEVLGDKNIAIVNADDPRCVREANAKVKGKQITFGRAKWARVRLADVAPHFDEQWGSRIQFHIDGVEKSAFLPLLGAHNAQNAAAAVATALALDLDIDKAISGLAHVRAVKGRLFVHALKNGAWLIDDTYNANPESMEAALSVLESLPGQRKIAVLGDMLELGEYSADLHHALGAACAQKHVTQLFTCGNGANGYCEGAFEAGLPKSTVTWAPDSKALAPIVASSIRPGDMVLVKGSRSMHMEIVVNAIRQGVN